MAIMQSCCCWRSVRRGSFACAVYTVIYYSLLAVTLATVLQEESQHAEGNDRTRAASNSILEPEASPATMNFNMALLACSSCGVICCLLLLYGLFKDEKLFLVPWICIVIACSLVDVAHLFYLFFVVSLAITPTTAMVLTIDFFLLCLNVYSVLCVISQYQEYAAGRGMASDDCEHGAPTMHYGAQGGTATATYCLSGSRNKAVTNFSSNETRGTASTPTTQSPTTLPTVVASSPDSCYGPQKNLGCGISIDASQHGSQHQSTKHVKFQQAQSAEKIDKAGAKDLGRAAGHQQQTSSSDRRRASAPTMCIDITNPVVGCGVIARCRKSQ
uniref:Uncharacterized protein n=1 Tax=Trichogramma kaykai TaxID=54128 RepID=A0ABD2W2M8_9HYME